MVKRVLSALFYVAARAAALLAHDAVEHPPCNVVLVPNHRS
jgi:hypothetical protein